MDLEREIIRALSDAHTTNCCLDCAKGEKSVGTMYINTELIRNTHKKSNYMLTDTGTCSICGGFGEVFCDKILQLQEKSGVSIDEWDEKYPRIAGGSAIMSTVFERVEGIKKQLNSEITRNEKIQEMCAPFWKKLFVSKKTLGRKD